MSDILLIYYASVAMILSISIGFAVGRIMDVYWRCKILRQVLKRDFGIVVLFNKDNRTMRSVMADFGKDELQVGKEKWVFDNRSIYRADKREKGFFVDDAHIRFEEGVPIIFVDHDHLTPISLYPPDGTTKPIEISAWLTSWVSNQMAKGVTDMLKFLNQYKMLLAVACIIALAAAGLAYLGWQNTNTIIEQNRAIITHLGNSTAVIIQPTPT